MRTRSLATLIDAPMVQCMEIRLDINAMCGVCVFMISSTAVSKTFKMRSTWGSSRMSRTHVRCKTFSNVRWCSWMCNFLPAHVTAFFVSLFVSGIFCSLFVSVFSLSLFVSRFFLSLSLFVSSVFFFTLSLSLSVGFSSLSQ